jgi:CHAT domain-containing protein
LRKFDFTPYLNELYQALFPKKIRTHLPQERGAKLVLVTHRRLSVIPIMALKDSTGHYLLENYSCHQVPGIGVLLRTSEILETRKKPGKIQGNEMLLYGNPTMPMWGRGVLSPLSGAENEVKAIAGKFKAGFQIGAEASEYAFKNYGRNKRVLHLATHGVSFDASPLESFVALAPGNNEDGQLTAAEILEMKFEADLVVLSACETGLGKISGDGVEGLARSFMASGVPSLVVSLWNVDDDATKALMLAFYDNLNQGLDKAEALRQAQLKIMRTPKWRHPKYWAAFVLYGER